MQVVILAGGKGTRLRPLTNNVPKPMVPIKGKPFLQHQMEFIRGFGLKDIVLLVGYFADQIIEYFGDGSKFNLNVQYSKETEPLGTGGALKNAQDQIAKEFLLLNGDTFLPIDYQDLLIHFHRNDTLATITVYNNPEESFKNNIAIGNSGLVVAYNKQESNEMKYVDAGALVLKKDALSLISGQGNCSLEEEIFPLMIDKMEMEAYITCQRFYDIGAIEGIRAVEGVLK